MMQHIDDMESTLGNWEININREVQFNVWLFQYLNIGLRKHGFVVHQETLNKVADMPNVNEYSTSVSDCLLYHESKVFQEHTSGIVLTSDSEDDDDHPLEVGNSVSEAHGNTFEVKYPIISESNINECFFNMFGGGTKLVSMSLRQGNVVNKLSMYGIVVSMQDPHNTTILHLQVDFVKSKCTQKGMSKVFFSGSFKYHFVEIM